ncbi:UMP-CMP kinase 2, mitochondrial-like [Salarias fasciatus]|uniref:UMP-CMP kinase 2, mitochondrial-like n=1 Tax=Salarias fasciatus TaxID=181472 RepID=UPI001176891C|nr:UMP-CMP kinase 2, mitochondrial-like [Salarias fasciatus]
MAAKHALPVLRWSSRVFSVELNGAPFYFALADRPEAEAPRLFGQLPRARRCFSLLLRSADRVHAARLHARLRDALLRELPPECRLAPMCSFLPEVRDSVLRGFFLQDGPDSPSPTPRLLEALAQQHALLLCSYTPDREHRHWTQHVWSLEGGTRVDVGTGLCVVCSEAPRCHPAALSMINSDVFRTFQDARDVLTECVAVLPEASSVLEHLPSRAPSSAPPAFPVLVVEGLDATGKTTLTESLRDALGAVLLRSPPQSLAPWRALFDREPPLLRRAFYAVGNYVTAEQAGQQAMKTPVVVDRFWHSTAAYAIATAVSGPPSGLPDPGSEVYRWPADLLRPSLVVLLTLDPEERRRRLRDRGQGKTEEERQLDHNQLFRLRVEEAYRRISGPPCIAVDASPSADQLLQQVLLLVRSRCCL